MKLYSVIVATSTESHEVLDTISNIKCQLLVFFGCKEKVEKTWEQEESVEMQKSVGQLYSKLPGIRPYISCKRYFFAENLELEVSKRCMQSDRLEKKR